MAVIPLTQGKVALVDDADLPLVAPFKWCAAQVRPGYWYATRGSRGRTIFMHRVILDAPKGLLSDHKNHDTLDNRRANLRLATPSQNAANRRKRGSAWRSRHRGVVYFDTPYHANPWGAVCREKHIGTFATEEEAARAYDAVALTTWGEFAYLNFPREAA